ncbi:MAG: putative RNA methylase [Planctomycetota bacterium]|jgi:predicted RNA methylase
MTPSQEKISPEEREALLEMDLGVEGQAWRPTPHGHFLAKTLAQHNLVRNKEVLELGAGVANHTILMLRQGASHIVATEIMGDLLESTRVNVERNCPGTEAIEYRVADWLHTDGRFDVIVSNPPFCKSGKQNRRYYLDSLILDSHKRLHPGGSMIFVQSSMADLEMSLSCLKQNGFKASILDQEQGEFRDYYFQDESFMAEIQSVPGGFTIKEGTYYETLSVIHAILQPFEPPDGAHIV